MILDEALIGYVHIPRTGGTSVEHALMKKHGFKGQLMVQSIPDAIWTLRSVNTIDNKRMRGTVEFHKKHATFDELVKLRPHYKYYATVRHPEDRLESLYRILTFSSENGIPWVNTEFNQFVKEFITHGNYMRPTTMIDNTMFRYTQVEMLGLNKNYFPTVEWHRLEDKTIWKALDIEPQLRYAIPRTPIDWTEESLELVHDYYREDYDIFGYDRGL